MVDAALDLPQDTPRALPIRQLAAVVAGNALQFYDFLTYSFFSIQIGHTFFPQQSGDTRLLLAVLVFGVGFLTRPLGAFVIGRWGDRVGRKPAMVLSFALMGLAITGLALTPSYTAIGMAAPILFVFFRLVQGFALGGEVGPTTAYLLEAAPPLKRGFYASLQFGTQDLSVLFAGIVGYVLANTLSPAALGDWGWRIAFLIGAAVVPFALVVRRTLPETFEVKSSTKTPFTPELWRMASLGIVLLMTISAAYFVIDYMTTFAEDTLHITPAIAFIATISLGLTGTVFDVLGGILSDRFGRKAVTLTAGVVYVVAIYPIYYAIIHLGSATALIVGAGILGALQGLYAPPILIGLTEGIPRAIRSGALSLIYAIAMSISGFGTQVVVKALITYTKSSFAPAAFMTVAIAIGVTAMFFVRETAPIKIGQPSA
jgi:MHS family citrate/tricarballylate:H+ symporter-like MFS transporter